MPPKKKRAVVEWVGGLMKMPAYVAGEGEPYRPEVLFWMNADGAVVGHTVGEPGSLIGLAAESLRSTIERPMVGPTHVPQRVRVASTELAEALRVGHAGLEIVCAPTPELEEVFEVMREKMNDDAEGEQSYLSPELRPEDIAAFFHAAAALYRAQPWKTAPGDGSLIAVTIEELGVQDAAISIIGQMGESFGFIVFASLDDFDDYLVAAEAMEDGEKAKVPPHFALNFERGAELTVALQKEIATHRWEVAGPEAYPWIAAIDEDLVSRPLTTKEFTITEAIALALPGVLNEKKALLAAWNGGEAVSRTLTVKTHAGEIDVTLRIPHAQIGDEATDDVLYELAELGEEMEDGDEVDPEARRMLEKELVRRFVESPEGKAVTDVDACHFVMDLAADSFGATIATMVARDLKELVFEIIPRKVSIDASAASWIIETNRAFYAFLGRELGLPHANECLRVLGGDAVQKLEAALSDKTRFGPAKSLVMRGREAGFDMTSREGIEAWMRVAQSQPLPASIGLPSPRGPSRTVDKAAAKAKQRQRKASRKARKRNR